MCAMLVIGIVVITGILYSCLVASTTYDKYVDDVAQEDFLKKYKR